MKKGVFLAVLITLLLLSQTGCGNTAPRPAQNYEPSDALLSADLFSWMMNFDGYELQFPMTVNAFTHATATSTELNSKEMVGRNRTGMTYINTSGGHKMTVYIYADTDAESIPLGDCMLSELKIDISDAKVIFPKGLTFESTREDVILAYGEPTKKEDDIYTYIDPEFTGPPAPYQPGAAPAIEFHFRLPDERREEYIKTVKYTGMTA